MPALTSRWHPIRLLRTTGLAALVVVAAFAAHLLTVGEAWAQEGMSSEDDDGWSYRLTPYIWLPSLSGSFRVDSGDPPADVDVSFLDLLDFAFLIAGEARKDRWGILGELNYLVLSESAATDGTIYLGAKVGLDATMGSLFAAYRAYDGADASLDVLAGARAWWLDLQIDYQAGTLPARSVEQSSGWVDPVVGLRGQIPATDRIVLTGIAGIGGFGVGTDLQWEVLASASYLFNQSVSASIGYRHLEIDFDDGSFLAEFGLSGPYLAVSFNF
jgi:hypothetical protein